MLVQEPPRLARKPVTHSGAPSKDRTRCVDWSALEPRGFYPSVMRPILGLLLVALLLPAAAVLGAAIALANWSLFGDRRRILFTQPRVGQRGQVFSIFKFRTMQDSPPAASLVQDDDHVRVTTFGRFLRNTHLDELPQILNVLRGEMGLIGPRPEMVEIEAWASEHIAHFSTRLVLKPGISGCAQITQGYTPRDLDAYSTKLMLNEYYRRRVSLTLDAAIVIRTAVWMLLGRGWRVRQKLLVAREGS